MDCNDRNYFSQGIKTHKTKGHTLLFDSAKKDKDAPVLAEELGSRLYGLVKKVEVLYLEDGDPDDMTEKEVLQLRKEIRL